MSFFPFFWAWSGQPAIGQVRKKDSWVGDKRVMGQNRKCMHFLEDWSAEIKQPIKLNGMFYISLPFTANEWDGLWKYRRDLQIRTPSLNFTLLYASLRYRRCDILLCYIALSFSSGNCVSSGLKIFHDTYTFINNFLGWE